MTFFRPYLWEARNPVVMLGAIESSIFLALFIFILYKLKWHLFTPLKGKYLLSGLVIFIIIFGFAVGFTSYNFGALGRYKIPIMSPFSMILIYIIIKTNKIEN